MRDTVDGPWRARGRTPIGASLLATPDDLGSAEGRRSVVLVSDGGDNCAPPDPCKAAAQVAKQGVDLSISVVGLQVNERVRKQLECIARAGGGSYVDVQDAGKLGQELAAALGPRVPLLRAVRDEGQRRGRPSRPTRRGSAPGSSRTRCSRATSAGTRSRCPPASGCSRR